jgi:ribosomal protein S18 acetylase RimI-like enzyme
MKEGIQTIGLNVSAENPATKLYQRLGFRKACSYVEGPASLRE